MKQILLVALGGGVGAVARYELGGWIMHRTLDWRFPLSTFVVNVLGCLVAGALMGLAEKHNVFSADARLLIFTGLLGGFTTFSAFGVETVYLLQRHEVVVAACYVGLSISCGLAAMWCSLTLVMSV